VHADDARQAGRSRPVIPWSGPWSGPPATDPFAAALKAVLDHLALDQDVVLAGFSMGTREVTRYLGTYGSAGVSKAVLLGAIPPFLLQTDENPKGVPGSVFEGIKNAIVADRYAYFDDFFASTTPTSWRPSGSAMPPCVGASTSRPPPVRSRATPAWIRG
jgi:pimeloyl-ACP methyl ester carboxylesterase